MNSTPNQAFQISAYPDLEYFHQLLNQWKLRQMRRVFVCIRAQNELQGVASASSSLHYSTIPENSKNQAHGRAPFVCFHIRLFMLLIGQGKIAADTQTSPQLSFPMPNQLDLKRAQLNTETAQIAWTELQGFFAKGALVHVSSHLDLVDVAAHIACDDFVAVQEWMTAGKVLKLDDETAADWQNRNPLLWAVVVAPWILVQERAH